MKEPLIIIFGAGNKGRMLLRTFANSSVKGRVHCFIDSDPARWGDTIGSLPVRKPGYLKTLPVGSFKVYVAVGAGFDQVCKLLVSYGLTEGKDFVDARIKANDLAELDEIFRSIRGKIKDYTLLSNDRLHLLHQFAKAASQLPGEAAELGVYRGGSAYLLASVFSHKGKKLRLFDTFSGIPPVSDAIDIHLEGDFSDACPDEVSRLLNEFAGIVFHPGIFPETASGDAASDLYCFIHVDADLYRSVLDACIFFYPRLTTGGMIIFDDYGFPSCPGVRKAVDEYFADKPQKPIYLPSGQALVINSH
jgi:O-methyltransferase